MQRRKGFTLIELLIVVAIIGILAAIAVPNFVNAQVRAKVTRAVADMHAISNAVKMYQLDQNAFMPVTGVFNAIMDREFRAAHIWKQLTTPIAYLSTILQEPFKPINNPFDTGPKIFVEKGMYQYRNIAEDRQYGLQGDPHPDALWLARSTGPDRWYFNHPARLYRDQAYKTSNGLKSAGDLIVSNLGLLGEGYAGRQPPSGAAGGNYH